LFTSFTVVSVISAISLAARLNVPPHKEYGALLVRQKPDISLKPFCAVAFSRRETTTPAGGHRQLHQSDWQSTFKVESSLEESHERFPRGGFGLLQIAEMELTVPKHS
jgi:hypothetical protein